VLSPDFAVGIAHFDTSKFNPKQNITTKLKGINHMNSIAYSPEPRFFGMSIVSNRILM